MDRPECVGLYRERAPELRGPAIVEQIVFLGDSTRYRLQLPNGTRLWARAQQGRYDFAIDIGHTLWVGWQPEHVLRIERDIPEQSSRSDQPPQRD